MVMTPMCEICDPIGSLFYASSWSGWPPRPNVGLVFTEMYYLIVFNWFSIQMTPFSFDLRSFWPEFLQNLRSDSVQYFIATKDLVNYPHPSFPPTRGHHLIILVTKLALLPCLCNWYNVHRFKRMFIDIILYSDCHFKTVNSSLPYWLLYYMHLFAWHAF